ncbi:magnesium/cobalt transporter CorA [soil metagenome]
MDTLNPTADEATNKGMRIRAIALTGLHGRDLTEEQAVAKLKGNHDLVWIDVEVTDRIAAEGFLEGQLGFHRLAVEDALSEMERPTLQQFDDYIFFAIPALNDPHDLNSHVEVGFFLMAHALVTVSTAKCELVDTWLARWKAHPRPIGNSSAMLLHSLVDGIVDGYFPLVDAMEDQLDCLADQIFAGDTTQVKQILILKRQLLDCRRRITPVRDIMNGLLRRDITLIPDKTKPYFQDVFDHVIRISELLDTNRETLASLLDVHLSQVSNNLNIVVKKMTVVATVLMIMTLVAGVYGMNFEFMPELHWRYGYEYALSFMVLLGVGTVMLFRKIKWI